ncbi:MAG: bifunctional riboflavin kinase/FAD synthetase [Labilithrix sp.]|nr:bifunctional riboflavin kinase/FAD synthetase [Labilithrix sp.]MCW5833223.1 bifunctional riboflavin kinase/FAD synthetase [Labilithrix sp.]
MQSAVIIGNLDGVHRGHQAVLRQARALADARGLCTVVLTFDPHPSQVLRGFTPPRLATLERRVELLRRHGADDVVVEPFTLDFAALTPSRFAKELLVERLGARAVVVGENFRFGAKRAGDLEALRGFGRELGFEVAAAEVAGDERGPFSSTRVRDAIAGGDLDEATRLLGRRHSISGVVEGGDRRGRTIGFPTANLGGVPEVLPPRGVYAVFADDRPGVMNLGVRPTVDGANLRVEVHLFDFDGDLYGQSMRVHLVSRIRDEKKFSGLDELRAQIALDAEAARRSLATAPPGDGG